MPTKINTLAVVTPQPSDVVPITSGYAGSGTGVVRNAKVSDILAALSATFTASGGAPYTSQQVYAMAYPPAGSVDTVSGVAYLPAGFSGTAKAAVSGYAVTDAAVSGGLHNGVGLFGVGIAHADNSNVWGINTLVTDSDSGGAATTGTGRKIQAAEFDVNFTSPHSTGFGMVVAGVWAAQATGNAIGISDPGGSFYWATGLLSADGACAHVVYAGLREVASGNSIGSQDILFANTDGSGTAHNAKLQVTSTNVFAFTGDSTPATITLDGGPAQFDSSTSVPTTAWVTNAGPMIPAQTVISGSTTLTNAHAGHFLPITAAGAAINLPQASTMLKASLFFHNESSGTVTLSAHSGDTSPVTSINSDGVVWLVATSSGWFAIVNTRGNPKTSITGSRGSATATVLENLLTALAAMGLVTDNTTT